jgi:hypothetical protein
MYCAGIMCHGLSLQGLDLEAGLLKLLGWCSVLRWCAKSVQIPHSAASLNILILLYFLPISGDAM